MSRPKGLHLKGQNGPFCVFRDLSGQLVGHSHGAVPKSCNLRPDNFDSGQALGNILKPDVLDKLGRFEFLPKLNPPFLFTQRVLPGRRNA